MINNLSSKEKANLITWLFLFIIFPVITGLYGIVLDYISFEISEEFFTNYKFYLFEIPAQIGNSTRLSIAYVAFRFIWTMGLPVAFVLGVFGFKSADPSVYISLKIKSVAIILCTTVVFSALGYPIANFVVNFIPENYTSNVNTTVATGDVFVDALFNLTDLRNFVKVVIFQCIALGTGGTVGLAIASVFQVKQLKKIEKNNLPIEDVASV